MKKISLEKELVEKNTTAVKAFYVMFTVSVLSIIIQLIFYNAELKVIIDELFVVLLGGIIYLYDSIRRIFLMRPNNPLSVFENALVSILCALVVSVLYGLRMSKKYGTYQSHPMIGRNVGIVFIVAFVLFFAVFFGLERYMNRIKKQG